MALWELWSANPDSQSFTRDVGAALRLPTGQAETIAEQVVAEWRMAGLQDRHEPESIADAEEWVIEPEPAVEPGMSITSGDHLVIGRIPLRLEVEDHDLRHRLLPQFAGLTIPQTRDWPRFRLRVTGRADQWNLDATGRTPRTGGDLDGLVVGLWQALVDLACRAEERLLVIHGAGLVDSQGGGVLLIAPGGSGKTTLAAALNACGWPLLNDDVVPVSIDGRLVPLKSPICLKTGSWPVLASRRPKLWDQPVIQRLGQAVRYLAPVGEPPASAVLPRCLLFPSYRPGVPAGVTRLNPELALQGIVQAEAVIRGLTQQKLSRLANWVASMPAWSFHYPDLDSGLACVHSITWESRDGCLP
jgi:hypothetical protein